MIENMSTQQSREGEGKVLGGIVMGKPWVQCFRCLYPLVWKSGVEIALVWKSSVEIAHESMYDFLPRTIKRIFDRRAAILAHCKFLVNLQLVDKSKCIINLIVQEGCHRCFFEPQSASMWSTVYHTCTRCMVKTRTGVPLSEFQCQLWQHCSSSSMEWCGWWFG